MNISFDKEDDGSNIFDEPKFKTQKIVEKKIPSVLQYASLLINQGYSAKQAYVLLLEKFLSEEINKYQEKISKIFSMEGIVGCILLDATYFHSCKDLEKQIRNNPNIDMIVGIRGCKCGNTNKMSMSKVYEKVGEGIFAYERCHEKISYICNHTGQLQVDDIKDINLSKIAKKMKSLGMIDDLDNVEKEGIYAIKKAFLKKNEGTKKASKIVERNYDNFVKSNVNMDISKDIEFDNVDMKMPLNDFNYDISNGVNDKINISFGEETIGDIGLINSIALPNTVDFESDLTVDLYDSHEVEELDIDDEVNDIEMEVEENVYGGFEIEVEGNMDVDLIKPSSNEKMVVDFNDKEEDIHFGIQEINDDSIYLVEPEMEFNVNPLSRDIVNIQNEINNASKVEMKERKKELDVEFGGFNF